MPTHNAIELSMQELSKYFKMPEKAVAKHLGICLTSLKKICRANGINRWPYRKVRTTPCASAGVCKVKFLCPVCPRLLRSCVGLEGIEVAIARTTAKT